MTAPLTDIEVEWHDDETPDHVEIAVTARIDRWDPDNYPSISERQAQAIAVRMAGILARLGMVALDAMYEQEREHQCGRTIHAFVDGGVMVSGCHVSSPVDAIADPREDFGNPPAIWLVVPANRKREWLKRIHGWLDQLASTEA